MKSSARRRGAAVLTAVGIALVAAASNAGVVRGSAAASGMQAQVPSSPLIGTVTLLDVPPEPSTAGQAVTLTARVVSVVPGSPAPGGSVEFFAFDTSLGTATLASTPHGQVATLAVSSLGGGPHVLSARYPGDTKCAASRSFSVMHTVSGQ
jgi:hypothetical protein